MSNLRIFKLKAPMNIEQYTVAPIPCKASQRCPQETPTNGQQYQCSLPPTGARHEVCLPGTVERWRSGRAWHSVVSGRNLEGAGRNLNGQPDNDLFSLVCCPVAIVRVFKFWLTDAGDSRRHTAALAIGQSGQAVVIRDFERRDQYD